MGLELSQERVTHDDTRRRDEGWILWGLRSQVRECRMSSRCSEKLLEDFKMRNTGSDILYFKITVSEECEK